MIGTLLGGRSSWTIGVMKDSWWVGFLYLGLVFFGVLDRPRQERYRRRTYEP